MHTISLSKNENNVMGNDDDLKIRKSVTTMGFAALSKETPQIISSTHRAIRSSYISHTQRSHSLASLTFSISDLKLLKTLLDLARAP